MIWFRLRFSINNKSGSGMLKKYFQDYESEEDENYEPTAK